MVRLLRLRLLMGARFSGGVGGNLEALAAIRQRMSPQSLKTLDDFERGRVNLRFDGLRRFTESPSAVKLSWVTSGC